MCQSVNNNISAKPISVVQDGWHSNESQFAANIPGNDIFMIQSYVFRANPPTPNSGTGFQTAINEMVRNWGDIIRSIRDNNLNMQLFAIVQTHESPQVFNYRLPSKEEILLGVNMALAYGAKGIVYYLYAQVGDQTGLLDANRNPTAKYYDVQDINVNYLNLHGPKFLPLMWKEGFTIHQNTQEPISSIASIYDVKTKPPGGNYDPESETYVEIGYFTDSSNFDYYMVVNRRATAKRQVEITFQSYPNAEHKVKDMFTGVITNYSKSVVGSDGHFIYTTVIDSGAAKLLLLDKAPASPKNLIITNAGQNGQNPILQWDANTESDLDHYAIYKGYQDSKTSPINWNSNPSVTTTNTTWTDPFVTINTSAPSSVHYRITAIDNSNNESDYSNSVSTNSYQTPKIFYHPDQQMTLMPPKNIELYHNYPNPFNSETKIRFDLPEKAHVIIKIYNVLGKKVRTLDNDMEMGFHAVIWNEKNEAGEDLPSGIYIYKFQVNPFKTGGNSFLTVKKLTLLR